MPTKTFFNLPKEKKMRILKAGKKEFSRVPLEKAVIANIAKDASIPRGSFYQYFNSLEDLFSYVVEYMYGFNKQKFAECLKENNNNIYETLKDRFKKEIDRLSKEENRQFRINTFSLLINENNNYSKKFIENIIDKCSNVDLEFLPLEYQKSSTFSKMINLIKIVGDNCVQRFITSEVSQEEIIEDYNEYVDLMRTKFE